MVQTMWATPYRVPNTLHGDTAESTRTELEEQLRRLRAERGEEG